ncbi:YtcA family lipoprotein [Paraburkholderia sp. FT54]|uniref:YtcA family lipoprotein n=1 Tax=Paraburkholderia sp. FT54 TaxID=3074437 RepID=UPI0028774B2A|nr:YtcA family lipoprotein [Paraburkholderia sp. FT54]WNC89162.1 YtcA family lipoprotein [Paraburkholderia sp. FT54]
MKPSPSLPETRDPRRAASDHQQGVTLLSTTETSLNRHMPLARGRCSKRAIGVAMIAAIPMSGCTNSPSISVLGAYFPDWLFCIVAGVVLTVVIYLILNRLQADHLMGPSAVVYPTLVAFLALAVWLMLFQH